VSAKEQRGVEVMEAIRGVLFDDWDPLGVNEYAPRDEYDAYIAGVYRLLCRRASEEEIAEHLRGLEWDEMGLAPRTAASLLPVARKLLGVDVASSPEAGRR